MYDFFPTNIDSLDRVLGGGIYKGNVATIKGAPASGKTMFLSAILSGVNCPVMHFLTENKFPDYVRVAKENYTFACVNKANDILDKIGELWMNGFEGILAVDGVDNLEFEDLGGVHPGIHAKQRASWLRWFFKRTGESPTDTRLTSSKCSLIITYRTCQYELSGRTFSSVPSDLVYASSQEISVRKSEEELKAKITKNKFFMPCSDELSFSIIKDRGIDF
jgi:hypothetical protein